MTERDAGVLRYLDELGIRPGADVVVTARAPFGGPITIAVGADVRLIGPALAAQVLVTAPET